jgi:hypothetical protein
MSDHRPDLDILLFPHELEAELLRRYRKIVEEGRVVVLDEDDGDIIPADVRHTTFSTWRELHDELVSRDERRERNAAFMRSLERKSEAK